MFNDRLSNLPNFFKGSLIAGAAGDALGNHIEFWSYNHIVQEYGEEGVRHIKKVRDTVNPDKRVAQITDDTQMTLFTANGLLVQFTHRLAGDFCAIPDVVYRAYLDWYECVGGLPEVRRPQISWIFDVPQLHYDRASGSTCTASMRSARPRSVSMPINDRYGCGGVMRIAPYALFNGKMLAKGSYYGFLMGAAEIGAITHSNPLSHLGCQLAATITALIIYGDPDGVPATLREAALRAIEIVRRESPEWAEKPDFFALIDKAVALAANDRPDPLNIQYIGKGFNAHEAIAIAVYCLLRHEDFTECLLSSVNHYGDSDSTGEIVGCMLGAFYGYDAIPAEFKTDIEIQSVIEQIAEDLAAAVDPTTDPATFSSPDWQKRYNYPLD